MLCHVIYHYGLTAPSRAHGEEAQQSRMHEYTRLVLASYILTHDRPKCLAQSAAADPR